MHTTFSGYAVVDVETTGFSPATERVLEVAVVHVSPDGEITGSWDTLVHPQGPVKGTQIHGITAAMVDSAPAFADVAAGLGGLLAGRVVTAHNLSFDARFLTAEFGRTGMSLPELGSGVCTMKLAKLHLPGPSVKLADCCARAGIPLVNAHAARFDAEATAVLLARFLRQGVVGRAVHIPAQATAPDLARFVSRAGTVPAPRTVLPPAADTLF